MKAVKTVQGFEIVKSTKLNGWFTTKCGTISAPSLSELEHDCKDFYRTIRVAPVKGAKVYKYGIYAGFVLLAKFKNSELAYDELFEKESFYQYQADQPSVRAAQIKQTK